jgi:hypothetical protein
MSEQDKTNTVETSKETPANDFSKVAGFLNKQTNPLTEPQHESFKAEPFFKQEETKEEETKSEEEKKPETQEAAKETPEVKTEPAKETTPSVETTREVPEYEIVAQFNDKAGTSFGSLDEITSALEEYQKFKQAESEVLQLSSEDRARLEIGREYGDYTLYDRIMSIDTTKLTHKEALRQAYLLEHEGTPQFLEKAFEREFKKSYEEDPDEEFSKDALENNAQQAIKKIRETQESFKQLGQVNGGVDPEEAKRVKAEADEKWFASVDSVLNKVDRLTYQLEDGLNLNIVMDAKDKNVIQAAMDQPIEWLRREITDDKGATDHEALMELVFRHVYYEKALQEAYKLGAASQEEKILKQKKNITIETTKAGDPGQGSKPLDSLAEKFRQSIPTY